MGLAARQGASPDFSSYRDRLSRPGDSGRGYGLVFEAHSKEGEPVFYQKGRTMIREEVSIHDTIEYLNELLALDAKAMATMIGSRVQCNDALRDHHTALVLATGPAGSNARVGMLGLLNGLFGVRDDGLGEISAVFDKGKLVRFERTPRIVDIPETVICE
jgi:hypothetical protein